MSRSSVYTFLLTTCLLLTPCAFLHAGTDDSGLQVFTVDFSKQLGESADVAQEDTLFSPYCYNMFSSGNGLTTFPDPKGTGTLWGGYLEDISEGEPRFLLVKVGDTFSSSTCEIFYHTQTPTEGRFGLFDNASTNTDFKHFFGGDTMYVFAGKLFTWNLNTGVTSEVTLSFGAGTSADVWQNRMFIGTSGNYVYYSTAQDYTDFTVGPTTGGVIRIWDALSIFRLISTKYGLYVFTSSGIFLLSGTNKNSWSLEKISNIVVANGYSACKYDDAIFFVSTYQTGKAIYSLNGINISVLTPLPLNVNVQDIDKISVINNGNFICLIDDFVGATSFLYDINTKSFIATSTINFVGNDYYFGKNFYSLGSTYRLYEMLKRQHFNLEDNPYAGYVDINPLSPWAYQTNWLTLDGNASNRKEIDRIEFDYQGGTVAVGLYYAYGNGSSSGAAITLTAPVNTRLSTYVWNAPIGRQQSNRFYLYFLSNGAQTMTTNYILKQARIYYRNIGNYKTNSLR